MNSQTHLEESLIKFVKSTKKFGIRYKKTNPHFRLKVQVQKMQNIIKKLN